MSKTTIACYTRVSTVEQATEGHSIEEQTERMIKYCEAMGWKSYKVYTDAGYSGGDTNRPALQKMIKDIKAGKIEKVLVYKLDRLSRSQLDTLYLIEKVFIANGCDFVSMSENFDTSTPFGRAMIGILAVFAQLEREQIKERMQMGREARAKQGKFHGSAQIPIGYDYIDGELVTNEFEKMQIIKIFELYASGIMPNTIAHKLNEAGMIQKNGKWLAETVRNILSRKTYLGYTQYNGEWYKGTHEAFISQELFDKVQNIKAQRSKEHKERNRRSGKANSYLGGYIYCANCGAKYIKSKSIYQGKNRKIEYITYKCNSRAKKQKEYIIDPNCRNKIWKMEELDNLIFEEIRKLAIDPNYITEIKDNQEVDNRPAVIHSTITSIEEKIYRLMDLYTEGQMPKDILQYKIHDLNDQKEKLEAELEQILSEQKRKKSHQDILPIVQSFSDILERGNIDEIRTAIGALIDKIVIDEENVTIHWNF